MAAAAADKCIAGGGDRIRQSSGLLDSLEFVGSARRQVGKTCADARQAASDFAMAAPFVATDKEKQKKLQRPLGQRRDNYLKKGTQVLDLMVDSAASIHLAPAGTVLRLATDVETKNGPFIATADATARQMQVSNNGDFNARVKAEKAIIQALRSISKVP